MVERCVCGCSPSFFLGYVTTDSGFKRFVAGEIEMTAHSGTTKTCQERILLKLANKSSRVQPPMLWDLFFPSSVPFTMHLLRKIELTPSCTFPKCGLTSWLQVILSLESRKARVILTRGGQATTVTTMWAHLVILTPTSQPKISSSMCQETCAFLDKSVAIGAIDRNLLIGGESPHIGESNFTNPLTEVTVI